MHIIYNEKYKSCIVQKYFNLLKFISFIRSRLIYFAKLCNYIQ